MVKKPIHRHRKNERFDVIKFLNNWNKFDSIFGFITGAILVIFIELYFRSSHTIPQIVNYIRPFAQPLILMTVFAYCMTNSFNVAKSRRFPVEVKNGWQFASVNLISIGWILGGLIFIASGTPEILAIIFRTTEK